MPEPIPINELTFGVELEVILPSTNNGEDGRDAIAAALVAAGIPAKHERLTHIGRPWWKVTTDSTIGYANAEIVSPSRGDRLLKGDAGFADVNTVVDVLTTFGCRVNRNCGLHVHVGARDYFAQQIGFFKEIARTFAKFEPVLDTLVAPSRRGSSNPMCMPFRYNDRIERATSVNEIIEIYGGGDRHYTKLNLGAYVRHGTVEFRQHQGTINAQKIENWVKLCLRMVQHSARNTEQVGRGRREFVPPLRPNFPLRPSFPEGERDLSRGRALDHTEIPRFTRANSWDLRDYIIVSVHNPHREGTEFHALTERIAGYSGRSLYEFRREERLRARWGRRGLRGWLLYLMQHGHGIRIVRRSECPVDLPAEEQERRNEVLLAWQADTARLNREYDAVVEAARAAFNAAQNGPSAPVSRPPTDAAPTTLDGLMSLVGAENAERAYFTERQMELNP